MTIKEAADRLLKAGKITEQEYKKLETSGPLFTKEAADFSKILGAASNVAKKMLYPVALTGLSAALIKENIIDPIVQSQKINNSFDQLSEKTPQLAEKDQEQVKEYFDVIKSFSPKAAANPLVAGALVNKMMEFGGVDHRLVHDLVSIESGMTQPMATRTFVDSAAKAVTNVPLGMKKTMFDEKGSVQGIETTEPDY